MTAPAPKRGRGNPRPLLRTAAVRVLVKPYELYRLHAKAEDLGMTLADYVRFRLGLMLVGEDES
jgi:hypothetical protein